MEECIHPGQKRSHPMGTRGRGKLGQKSRKKKIPVATPTTTKIRGMNLPVKWKKGGGEGPF